MWNAFTQVRTAKLRLLDAQHPDSTTRHFKTRRRKMTFERNILVLTCLQLMGPCLAVAQEQRPAFIPLEQGNGASSSPSSSISIGGLSDGPIAPGEVVHINVFDAPDFSLVTRVSESGDIPFPILGNFHIAGLNSASAASMLSKELRDRNLVLDPEVIVTVDSSNTGITVLGEVHSPGIYPPPGKRQLSDLLAAAGGLNANTGRVIEITHSRNPGKPEYVSWDPTMHNTDNFNRPVFLGDRVLVRPCVRDRVCRWQHSKAGAYLLCGSQKMTLSEEISLAGGVAPSSATNKTYIVRTQPDGTRVVEQVDVKKVLNSRVGDPIVHEDDIIYISPSPLKVVLKGALAFAIAISPTLLYLR